MFEKESPKKKYISPRNIFTCLTPFVIKEMHVWTTVRLHFHLRKIRDVVLSTADEGAGKWHFQTVNGYDLSGWQVSSLDKNLLEGHKLTPRWSFRRNRGKRKDERGRTAFLRRCPENGPCKLPWGRGAPRSVWVRLHPLALLDYSQGILANQRL